MMANVIKDIGAVSAYALAVKYGFMGTEEEWATLQMQAGANAQKARTAANESESSAQRSAAQATAAASSAQAAQASAASAAGSATDAGNQATNAAASATRATEQATNAKNSASAAAQSEASAKQSEQNVNATIQGAVSEATASAQKSAANAAQSAENAAAAAQEAREVVQTAAQIDDAAASFEKVWSSQRTVDRLCPRFEAGGQVVSCYPVEGYPLSVVSQITAVQAGSGEPSPDNVRLITGWSKATLTRCGKNLFDNNHENIKERIYYGTDNILYSRCGFEITLPAGKYTFTPTAKAEATGDYIYLYIVDENKKQVSFRRLVTNGVTEDNFTFEITETNCSGLLVNALTYGTVETTQKVFMRYDFMLEAGETSSAFEPYEREIYIAPFDDTVYGGSYDWSTGGLTKRGVLILEDTTVFKPNGSSGGNYFCKHTQPKGMRADPICSHFHGSADGAWTSIDNSIAVIDSNILLCSKRFTSENELNNYIDSQYAAGTPVTVVYPLAEPIVTAGTGQTVTALEGENTLYSDSGETSVSGRANPVRMMEQVLARVAALENAAVSGE